MTREPTARAGTSTVSSWPSTRKLSASTYRGLRGGPPRRSRYVEALKQKAAGREAEGEVALERRRARELAAEDHLFEGKEKFVTRAYKEKQEDLARARAEQEARDAAEERRGPRPGGLGNLLYRSVLPGEAPGAAAGPEPAAAPPPAEARAGPGARGEAPGAGAGAPARAPEGPGRPPPPAHGDERGGGKPGPPAAPPGAGGGGGRPGPAAAPPGAEERAPPPQPPPPPPEPSQLQPPQLQPPPPPPKASLLKTRHTPASLAAARERFLARRARAEGGGRRG